MVLFVNRFTVPAGDDAAFLVLWEQVNASMSGKPGYVDHALHRSVDPGAPYRFVNLAHWESVAAWGAAHDTRFRALVTAPEWRGYLSTPVLYEDGPVRTGAALRRPRR